ncbi:transcriptional regulator ATRX homolog isoform X2 [Ipomoea triloba]|uniref:transcriptional regulator ATRX homolog isoform X2 n=2 Tax=Ipomoea triloba TaxID=35885 RepID=UPI00125D6AAF|nr:transcriptional regulator ATRX homolog isoform X2 [Ipomoea triloba]
MHESVCKKMQMAIGDSKKMRKNKNRNRSKEQHEVKNSNQNEIFPVEKEEKKKKNKRMNVELKRSKDEADISDLSYSTDQMETNGRGKKKKRSLKNKKKTENDDSSEKETVILDQPNEIEGGFCQEDSDANEIEENKDKSKRKKRKSEKKAEADSDANEVEEKQKGKSRKKRKSEKAEADSDANEVEENQKGKSRKERKSEKKTKTGGVARPYIDAENTPEQENGGILTCHNPNAEENFRGKSGEAEDVYELSSGDEDASKGMRKWITEYYQSRPGLQILQEKIDEYIVAYEAERERERKEKEARIAEDGWTVVVHNKGRKKTTDSETGIAVGSVSQAAVIDNMAKKKTKDIGLDFYRFQKREAKRNEIMELQSKFEQDKKRAQQLRAARKFRPL